MKGYLQSLTIYGLLVAMVGWVLSRLGFDPGGAGALLDGSLQLGGLALAAYGRARATTVLSGLVKPKSGG